jgi:hypothetical protein
MKPIYRYKPRFTTVLGCFLVLTAFSIGIVIAFPLQETRRKIVSDDFTKNRREAAPSGSGSKSQIVAPGPRKRRIYRLVSSPANKTQPSSVANAIVQLGVTIWRLRPADSKDSGRRALIREKGKSWGWVAERVDADAIFREGDHVRISVESPRTGYLYVVDRDLFADGTTGGAILIYPWSGTDNQLLPGRLIDIPTQEDDPSYFTARLTTANQVGELLTFIVTSMPLDLPISNEPFEIASRQIRDWEKMWGAVSERFEMEGGAGEAWTQEEQQAAAKKGTRQLTRDDPPPQTIFHVTTTDPKAVLVHVRLRYGK